MSEIRNYRLESPVDEYIEWKNKGDPNDFMKSAAPPQLNPYGITGNKEAMKYYTAAGPDKLPTESNPFMNVGIVDYNRKPDFGKASPTANPYEQGTFYKNLFRTPSDALWQRQASERQFYTMPVTSVPNEQTKFAMWLYGKNFVGKSGSIYNRYGYPYTPDSLVNTGVNAAEPENGGQLDNNFGTPSTYGASPWVPNFNYNHGFGGIPGAMPMSAPDRPTSNDVSPLPLYGFNDATQAPSHRS